MVFFSWNGPFSSFSAQVHPAHSSTTGFYTDRPQTAAVQKRPPHQQDKPFDALAEGVVSKDSRGDKTPVELFLAGVHSLPADLISAAKALATIDPASQDTYAVRQRVGALPCPRRGQSPPD